MAIDAHKNSTPPSTRLPDIYYRRHKQGAWVRSVSSLFMGGAGVLAYLVGIISIWQLAGIGASLAFLVLMNPPLLLVLRRATNLRLIGLVSLAVNLLEVIAYTAIIHFVAV